MPEAKRRWAALREVFAHPGKNLVIVLALLSAGFFAAYLRFRPYLGQEAAYTDGERVYDRGEVGDLRYAIWGRTEPLPAGINTASWETRATVSPDGRFLVFGVGQPGLNADLYIADLNNGQPSDPRPLRALNSEFDELEPAFGPGYLYFASNRPDALGSQDLYRAPYDDGEFSTPENLGPSVNTVAAETDPAPGPAGLAFASDRSRGARTDFDLYLAAPIAAAGDQAYRVSALEPLNSPWNEREPWFTSKGNTLLLVSDRDGGAGGFDLYRSVRDQGTWLPPVAMAGLNTERSEHGPTASPDGFTLWFSSEDTPSDSNLYSVPSQELYRVPGRPVGWLDLIILGSLLLLALLAFLAKKWEQLDILYKCFLISFLIHLLLLWLFRGVLVETEPAQRSEREHAIHVKIAPNQVDLANARERSGELQSTPTLAGLAQGPERAQDVVPEFGAGQPAQQQTELPSAELSQAPAPAAMSLARAEPVQPSQVPVAVPQAELQRVQGTAPDLTVASSLPLASASPAETRQTSPNRAQPAPAGDARAAPVAHASKQADSPPVQGPAYATANAGPTRQAAAESTPTAIALPRENVERHAGSAAELALQAPAVQGPTNQASPAPARASSAQTDRPEQSPSASLAKAELGPSSFLDSANTRQPASGAWIAPSAEAGSQQAPVAVAVPSENVQRIQGGVGEMEVAAAPSLSPAGRPVDQPGRASTRVADVPTAGPVARSERVANAEADTAAGGSPNRTVAPTEANPTHSMPSVQVAQAPSDTARPAVAEAEPSPSGESLAPLVTFGPRQSGPEPVSKPQQGDLEANTGELAVEKPGFASSNRQPAPVASDAPPQPDRSPAAELGPARQDLPGLALQDVHEAHNGPTSQGQATPQRATPAELDLVASEVGGTPSFRTSATDPASPSTWSGEGPADPSPTPSPLSNLAEQGAATAGGGEPGRLENTPYRSRFGTEKQVAIRTFGGSLETERAVAKGLEYLAGRQSRQGNWWSRTGSDEKYGSVTVGRTGLCLLAFLGAGHTQLSNTTYSPQVQRAIDFLLSVQDPASGHFGYTEAYSHAIATYALAECYALTEDEKLRPALEKAVAHILERQNKGDDPRKRGGWSYYYPDARIYDSWPRASITTWQVMALESARLGGLTVPEDAFRMAHEFLLGSHDAEKGLFLYSHDPVRLRSVYPTLPGSTPAALFALSLLGEDPNSAQFEDIRRYVLSRTPQGYAFTTEEQFVQRGQGNDYFWYYATLALFRCGGEAWDQWNKSMKATILPAQQEDGSWKPISIYAEVAGDTDWDRSYSTAMCVLTMEVYYRYFTPLLRVDQNLGAVSR